MLRVKCVDRWVASITLLAILLLVGCRGPAPAATPTTAVTATTATTVPPTLVATRVTVVPVATATATVTTPMPTAVPTAVTTLSPSATPTIFPRTAILATAAPTSRQPTGALYEADFAKWPQGQQDGQYPVRLTVDPAVNEYQIALTDTQGGYFYYLGAPDSPLVADFRLDVEARKLEGSVRTAYGVSFREQTPPPGTTQGERYVFIVSVDGFFSLNLVRPNAQTVVVSGRTPSPAVRLGSGQNRLTVICKGPEITLQLNGQVVGIYPATLNASGRIGILVSASSSSAGGTGTRVGFSSLAISSAP